MAKYYILLVVIILALLVITYSMLEVDYIYKEPNSIILISDNVLKLKEEKRYCKYTSLKYKRDN